MRLTKARIEPLKDTDWSDEQRRRLEPMRERGTLINVTKTLALDPVVLDAFMGWARYIAMNSQLAPRDREIVILRIGYLCRSGYEWTQHVEMGMDAGLTAEEVERIKQGASAPGWTEAEAALIRATDELHNDQFVSDATWAALKAHFTERQCMDMVFTAAQYTQVSMILNSFGVQLEPHQSLDPDLKAY